MKAITLMQPSLDLSYLSSNWDMFVGKANDIISRNGDTDDLRVRSPENLEPDTFKSTIGVIQKKGHSVYAYISAISDDITYTFYSPVSENAAMDYLEDYFNAD